MKSKNIADASGMACAGLCIAHCLLTPVLLLTFAGNPWLEGVEYVIGGCSVLAAVSATLKKNRSPYLIAIWVGVAILLLSILLEDHFRFAQQFVYGAGALLMLAHYFNGRHQARCEIKS